MIRLSHFFAVVIIFQSNTSHARSVNVLDGNIILYADEFEKLESKNPTSGEIRALILKNDGTTLIECYIFFSKLQKNTFKYTYNEYLQINNISNILHRRNYPKSEGTLFREKFVDLKKIKSNIYSSTHFVIAGGRKSDGKYYMINRICYYGPFTAENNDVAIKFIDITESIINRRTWYDIGKLQGYCSTNEHC